MAEENSTQRGYQAPPIFDFNDILRSMPLANVKATRVNSEEYGEAIHLVAQNPANEEQKFQSWYNISARKGTKFENLVSQMRELKLLSQEEMASAVVNGNFDELTDLIIQRINAQKNFSVAEKKGVGQSTRKTLVLTGVVSAEEGSDAESFPEGGEAGEDAGEADAPSDEGEAENQEN